MIPVIQTIVLPAAGLALLWLARRWVLRKYRAMPKPRERQPGEDPREKFRKDWGV